MSRSIEEKRQILMRYFVLGVILAVKFLLNSNAMQDILVQFSIQFGKSMPLFCLIGLGYCLVRWLGFGKKESEALVKFAFNVALPAMLFRLLAQQFLTETQTDMRLLIAFFGACLVLLVLFRFLAIKILHINPVGASVFGTACVFCNNGLLGLPLAIAMLGDEYLPSIACVITFNALILWTAVSILVEQGTKHITLKNFLLTVVHVFKNPLIISIFAGVFWNFTRIKFPYIVDEPLRMVALSATPLSLIAVGMGLAEYGISKGVGIGIFVSAAKLVIHPIAVFFLATLVGLGPIEKTAIVFLAALPCGVNVYLMSRTFHAIEAEIADAMLFSTMFAAITMPFVVTLLKHVG